MFKWKVCVGSSTKKIYRCQITILKDFQYDMQIKTMKHHQIPIRIAKTQNTDKTKFWGGPGAPRMLIHWWWESMWYSHLGRPLDSFSQS